MLLCTSLGKESSTALEKFENKLSTKICPNDGIVKSNYNPLINNNDRKILLK